MPFGENWGGTVHKKLRRVVRKPSFGFPGRCCLLLTVAGDWSPLFLPSFFSPD